MNCVLPLVTMKDRKARLQPTRAAKARRARSAAKFSPSGGSNAYFMISLLEDNKEGIEQVRNAQEWQEMGTKWKGNVSRLV